MDLIKQQISFYFSFANLSNDNVLLMKLLYEKEVSAEFLMKFNKLGRMLQEFDEPCRVLIELCKEIPELRVSEDRVGVQAQVSQEIIEEYRENAAGRSLYFENLPDWTDVGLVRTVFARYGKVLYVSLPKWSETGVIKGFGFAELDCRVACEAAVQEMNGRVVEEFKPFVGRLRVMGKVEWLGFKERIQSLKPRLRFDSPDREFYVVVTGLPEQITKTQINDMLEIKPWKIEYKQSSQKAKLIYTNFLDACALLRCQPALLGRQVYYSLLNKHI